MTRVFLDNKDWRVHLQNLQACAEVRETRASNFEEMDVVDLVIPLIISEQTIDTAWTASKNQMEKLNTDLEQTMEKIQSRESYINQHFEELV